MENIDKHRMVLEYVNGILMVLNMRPINNFVDFSVNTAILESVKYDIDKINSLNISGLLLNEVNNKPRKDWKDEFALMKQICGEIGLDLVKKKILTIDNYNGVIKKYVEYNYIIE